MKKIRIKRKIYEDKLDAVYDMTVQDSHHYILADGTISHNTQDLFSKSVAGGGCLAPGSLILMADDTFKAIDKIETGDKVKTLIGDKRILETFEFEKETYEVEFEDGTKVVCSADHRFYVGENEDDWIIEEGWINVKQLKEGMHVRKYD